MRLQFVRSWSRGRNHADGTDGRTDGRWMERGGRWGAFSQRQETHAAGIIVFRRPFCWPRPRIGRGSILFLPDRPIDASRHRYPSVTVRGGLAFSPFARPACLESPCVSNLSYIHVHVNPFFRCFRSPDDVFVHIFFSFLPLTIFSYPPFEIWQVSIGLLHCYFLNVG